MLVAVTVFAAVLGLGKCAGFYMPGAVVMAASVAGVVLVSTKKDASRIIYAVVCSGGGLVIGAFLIPVGFPAMQGLDALIVAAVVGWLLGGATLRMDDHIRARREEVEKPAGKEP